MRELLKSFMNITWALALLGIKHCAALLRPPDMGVRRPGVQGGLRFESSVHALSRTNHNTSGKSSISHFVVMGEGLAAGMGDFALSSETQQTCFAAQIATQMQLNLPQRLVQAPGFGNLVGFAPLPVTLPAPMQTTVITELPPGPVSNLAVPGLRLCDAIEMRPALPLVHRNDVKQTAINLNWGLVPISRGEHSFPTQLEYALQRSPSLTMIELGYYEALEASVNDDPGLLPKPDEFVSQYQEVVRRLIESGSDVLLFTVPDPLGSAHFFSVQEAASLLKVPSDFLIRQYCLRQESVLTLRGVSEIGYQLFAKELDVLPAYSVLSPGTPCAVEQWVAEINERLRETAKESGGQVFDLAGLLRALGNRGHQAGTRSLSGEYLGGFYSLNGYYPGATGQAIIGNEILQCLNQHYGSSFPLIDLGAVLSADPVAAYRQPGGDKWSMEQLEHLSMLQKPGHDEAPAREKPHHSRRDDWAPLMPEEAYLPLRLPPGLEQVLSLCKNTSYFGDGIDPINCRDANGVQWGSCGNSLFAGLAMVDSHLTGSIRIKFTSPVNGVSRFTISFEGGLVGDDADLAAPQYFKMAFKGNRVDEVPGTISSGTLNLTNGEVSDLKVFARYSSGALAALVGVNPTFPKQPLCFPGQYGSAWAKFEQRADGRLDFTFYGSTFVPLGKEILWPLNFVGPSGQFATVPAAGTVMHPHLALSTLGLKAEAECACPEIPFNTVQEFVLYSHNSAFGDLFNLNTPELGGQAKGRSHLLGRLQVQFGLKSGTTVPVAVKAMPPGGIMAPMAPSPITQIFPGRLSPGPQGFNENLLFPLRTYPLDDLAIVDDPFDICVGAIDLRTGQFVNGLLHRAFISQDLIFALLRIEPRTPKDSFFFRGPAVLTNGAGRQRVFRFRGIVHLPYPAGFLFPRPDFATPLIAGPDSALDPYLWFHAVENPSPRGEIQGEGKYIRSSTGDDISYRYQISSDGRSFFEYENHTQEGKFHLHSLIWVDFCDSGTSPERVGNFDTVTFSGFGVWMKDGVETLQQVAAQFSASAEKPYVAIQVASGDISNVNTKPRNEQVTFP